MSPLKCSFHSCPLKKKLLSIHVCKRNLLSFANLLLSFANLYAQMFHPLEHFLLATSLSNLQLTHQKGWFSPELNLAPLNSNPLPTHNNKMTTLYDTTWAVIP